MTFLPDYLLVFVGGGFGALLRHAVNRANVFLFGAGSWGTLFVNITGSFAMGLLVGWFALRSEHGGQALRLFLTTGILGGFTTFSTFSLEAALLWERAQLFGMACYVGGTVVAGIIGILSGIALVKTLTI